jgi:hypothetical protein
MRKDRRIENAFLAACVAVVIACFAGMLALGGCMPPEEDPIPQAKSETDLVEDEDRGEARSSLTQEAEPRASAGSRYDRTKALQYVRRYALKPNRRLAYCGLYDGTPADCTNFASQVLWHGGIPMRYSTSQDSGWWYRFSCLPPGSSRSWRQVNGLLQYLVTESGIGVLRSSARDLQVGDLIFYRVREAGDGYRCDGNLFNHTTVVSGFDEDGEPLVAYHSNEALDVPWKLKTGSRGALGEACAFAFVHIRD